LRVGVRSDLMVVAGNGGFDVDRGHLKARLRRYRPQVETVIRKPNRC
jgi:hypothetical protein